jgi:hypothetical protein
MITWLDQYHTTRVALRVMKHTCKKCSDNAQDANGMTAQTFVGITTRHMQMTFPVQLFKWGPVRHAGL